MEMIQPITVNLFWYCVGTFLSGGSFKWCGLEMKLRFFSSHILFLNKFFWITCLPCFLCCFRWLGDVWGGCLCVWACWCLSSCFFRPVPSLTTSTACCLSPCGTASLKSEPPLIMHCVKVYVSAVVFSLGAWCRRCEHEVFTEYETTGTITW